MDTTEIGFIGAGRIGEPMVERLLAAGHRVTVFARRLDVRDRLAELGAAIATSPGELSALPVVITCLYSDDLVVEHCEPIVRHMGPGSVFVSHTTGGPAALGRLGEAGAAGGVEIVEAPFSGTPEDVRNGALTVLLAGDSGAVDIADVIVSAYADKPIRTGGPGTALGAKLLNNALFGAFTQLLLTAVEAGKSLGIQPRALLEVLDVSSASSTAGRFIAGSGSDTSGYIDRVRPYMQKDLASVRAVTDELDIDIDALLAAAERGPMDVSAP